MTRFRGGRQDGAVKARAEIIGGNNVLSECSHIPRIEAAHTPPKFQVVAHFQIPIPIHERANGQIELQRAVILRADPQMPIISLNWSHMAISLRWQHTTQSARLHKVRRLTSEFGNPDFEFLPDLGIQTSDLFPPMGWFLPFTALRLADFVNGPFARRAL